MDPKLRNVAFPGIGTRRFVLLLPELCVGLGVMVILFGWADGLLGKLIGILAGVLLMTGLWAWRHLSDDRPDYFVLFVRRVWGRRAYNVMEPDTKFRPPPWRG